MPVFEASPYAVGCFNFWTLGRTKCFFRVGKVKALLQGWVLCFGFVYLANVPDLERRLKIRLSLLIMILMILSLCRIHNEDLYICPMNKY